MCVEVINGMADTIADLEMKLAEREWIPCSERLPSEFSDDERVLVTINVDVDGLGVILIPTYDVKSWYLKGYITAWMPLPEPWKGAYDEM